MIWSFWLLRHSINVDSEFWWFTITHKSKNQKDIFFHNLPESVILH